MLSKIIKYGLFISSTVFAVSSQANLPYFQADSALADVNARMAALNSPILFTQFPGEQLSLSDRRLDWNISDLILNGNGPLIEISRRHAQTAAGWFDHWRRDMYNWELSIPRVDIHTWIHVESRDPDDLFFSCKLGNVKTVDIRINNVSDFRPIALNPNIQYPPRVHAQFNNNWLIRCGETVTTRSQSIDAQGNALPTTVNNTISLLSPDGTVYHFAYSAVEHKVLPAPPVKTDESWYSWSRLVREVRSFYVTDIEDRFGNYVTFHYEKRPDNNGGHVLRVQQITASDGRVVDFEYQVDNHGQTGVVGSGRHLKKITAGTQTVAFHYGNNAYGIPQLKRVEDAEGRNWFYDYYLVSDVRDSLIKQVITPSGAQINYEYSIASGVSAICHTQLRAGTPGVSRRTISTGSDTYSISYSEFPARLGAQDVWVTEIIQPQVKKRYYHGCYSTSSLPETHPNQALQMTLLQEDVFGGANLTTLMRSTQTEWSTVLYNGQFKRVVGLDVPTSYLRLFQSKQRVVQDGENYTKEYKELDALGNPTLTHESNSAFSEQRYTRQTYQHFVGLWTLNQPLLRSRSANGVQWQEEERRTYYAAEHLYKGLPNQEFRFGQLARSFNSYHSSGQIETIKYGAGDRHWLMLNDYKRGVPQIIRVPQRYASNCTNPLLCFQQVLQQIDDNGWVTQKTDFNNYTTSYLYDRLGRLTRITPPSPWAPTTITYANLGSRFTQTFTRGTYEKRVEMDALFRPLVTRERDTARNLNVYVRQQFDAYNQPVFKSFPSSSDTESNGQAAEYDGLQRVTRQYSTVDNTGVDYHYLSGNRVETVDALGNRTTTTYRAFGTPEQKLPIVISQPEGVSTTLVYNLFDNVSSITQGGVTESRFYNAQQRLCRLYRPDVGATAYEYDTIGNVTWEAKGASGANTTCSAAGVLASEKTSFSYDNLGSIRQITYPDSSGNSVYTYDNQGNLTRLTSGSTAWEYEYTSEGLVDKETLLVDNLAFVLDPTYNAMEQVTSLSYPSGRSVTFTLDALGRTLSSGSYASNAQYFPNGQLKSFNYGNSLTFNQTLDNHQRPELRRVSKTANLLSHQYSYDANNNLTSIIDAVTPANSITNMTYDGLDRLKTANGFWGIGSFNYDAMGNIIRKTLGPQDISYTYNAAKRLTSISGSLSQSFTYDSRGNVTNNGVRAFTFNRANRLTSSGNTSYVYDGHGRRIIKTKNGAKTYSLYNSAGVLMGTYENNGYTDYYYLGSQLVAKYADPNTQSDEPGYTGHVEDNDLQLTYMQQRYYDPVIGRFYSNDPVGFSADKPMMFNRYAYANNNPYKFIDPDGKQSLGVLIGNLLEGKSLEESAKSVHETNMATAEAAKEVLSYTPAGTIVDAVETVNEAVNGENIKDNLAGMTAGEIAGTVTEKLLDNKIGKEAAGIVGAVVGKLAGDEAKDVASDITEPKPDVSKVEEIEKK